MERIIIVINKSWEADAAFAALFNPDFIADLPKESKDLWVLLWKDFWNNINPGELDYPHSRKQGDAEPSLKFTQGNLQLEIWCLNNIMTPPPDPHHPGYYFSYSLQKAKDIAKIVQFSSSLIRLVVAFGTAGIPSEVSKNGGVVIGSGVFPYNANKLPPELTYANPNFGKLVTSIIQKDFFDQINIGISSISMKLFFETSSLTPPENSSSNFQIIADADIVAVGDMNTSGYKDFALSDKAALDDFANYKKTNSLSAIAYSVETTHGIIRMELPCDNFIFISAITDRYSYFDSEVTPKLRAQNFSAAFNGGVFLNWFIPFCFKYFSQKA